MWTNPGFLEQSWLSAVADTLDDFEAAVTSSGAILYPRRASVTELPVNIAAAAVASGLGLASLDYAKRRYVQPPERPVRGCLDEYQDLYSQAKHYIESAARRLQTNDDVPLAFGVLAASVALERLRSTFYAMSLLYRMGLNYEGDAVARMALEQAAWSLSAAAFDDEAAVSAVSATKSVSTLKSFAPVAGVLYGLLSQSTHAGLAHHRNVFEATEDGGGFIRYAWHRLYLSGLITAHLADIWVLVWERTQRDHIREFVAVDPHHDFAPLQDRPFVAKMKKLTESLKNIEDSAGSHAAGSDPD